MKQSSSDSSTVYLYSCIWLPEPPFRSPFPVSLSRLTQVAVGRSVLSFHAWNLPSLLAHHPGEEGESHLFEVGILPWKGVEIHQSLLIEEEKRALYALQNGKPWMVLKKPLKAQHSSDIIQLIEISTKR